MVSTQSPALSAQNQFAPPPAAPEVPRRTSRQVDLSFPDHPVDPKGMAHKGSGLHSMVAYVLFGFGLLAFIIGTSGLGLFALIAAPIGEYFRFKKLRAKIMGSGVRIGPDQMPFLYNMFSDFSTRLGLAKVPEVYIVEDSMMNGVAMKLGTKDVILLTDDVVWGALKSKDPRALGFVVGHELAHIAAKHTGTIRTALTNIYKPLSRCDEYTADNVATALVGDPSTAIHGLTVLTVGPQLLKYINDDALLAQADEVARMKLATKAERGERHPLLLRRIANVRNRG